MKKITGDSVSSSGFTLIELMMTLVVLAILSTIAAPPLRTFVQNNRVTSHTNEFVTLMRSARAEAVRLRSPVSVCPGDAQAENPTCSTDWTDGWLLVVDSQAAGATSAGVGTLLRAAVVPNAGFTHAWNGEEEFIRFLPDGRIDPVSLPQPQGNQPAPAAVFDVSIEACRGENARQIGIGRSGRVSVERVACPG